MKKTIIIGASSGIGKELAKILSQNNFELGLLARRLKLLNDLQKELKTKTFIKQIDLAKQKESLIIFNELLQEMQNIDLIIVTAGVGYLNPNLDWQKEKETIDINILGCTAIINSAIKYFKERKNGQLVVITSIAGLRGSDICPAYNASKSFLSVYLQGLRKKIIKEKLNITITDIKPGLVNTRMAQGNSLFWVADPKIAALQIFQAIKKKKKIVYITKRWRLIAWVYKFLPNCLYNRL
jgi:short-subunit dehydrogenase